MRLRGVRRSRNIEDRRRLGGGGRAGLGGVGLLVVLAITLALLLAATRVYKYIGNTGANIISRVMGMLLAAVAVDAILGGMDVMGLATVVGGAGEMLSGAK